MRIVELISSYLTFVSYAILYSEENMMNQLIILIAEYAIFLLPVFAVVLFFSLPRTSCRQYLLSLVLGSVCAFILVKIAGQLIIDPRPFVSGHVVPLFPHIPYNGFPSDHTTFGTTLAFIGFFYSRKWGLVMIPIAILIGAARVFAHVHHWSDIIGGTIVGLIAATAAISLATVATKKLSQQHKGELHAQ